MDIFLPLNSFFTFVKNHLGVFAQVCICVLHCVLLICAFIFLLLHYSHYWSYIVILNIGKSNASHFIFLVKFVLALLGPVLFFSFLLNKDFIYFQTKGKGGRKRGRETSICCCLSCPPTGDLACNTGMCPDQESNQQPFGSQAGTQSTDPNQPGPKVIDF